MFSSTYFRAPTEVECCHICDGQDTFLQQAVGGAVERGEQDLIGEAKFGGEEEEMLGFEVVEGCCDGEFELVGMEEGDECAEEATGSDDETVVVTSTNGLAQDWKGSTT